MTDNITNHQKSEFVIASILKYLFDQGIQSVTLLHFSHLEIDAGLQPFFDRGCGWLLNEGIITCTNEQQIRATNVVMANPAITAKGYALLGQSIQVGDRSVRLSEEVERASSGNFSASAIGDFIGGILGGLTKSISS